jgi:hypothetical protein
MVSPDDIVKRYSNNYTLEHSDDGLAMFNGGYSDAELGTYKNTYIKASPSKLNLYDYTGSGDFDYESSYLKNITLTNDTNGTIAFKHNNYYANHHYSEYDYTNEYTITAQSINGKT